MEPQDLGYSSEQKLKYAFEFLLEAISDFEQFSEANIHSIKQTYKEFRFASELQLDEY